MGTGLSWRVLVLIELAHPILGVVSAPHMYVPSNRLTGAMMSWACLASRAGPTFGLMSWAYLTSQATLDLITQVGLTISS